MCEEKEYVTKEMLLNEGFEEVPEELLGAEVEDS